MTADIDKAALALRFANAIDAQAVMAESIQDPQFPPPNLRISEARVLASILREYAGGGWRPIDDQARHNTRILLAWRPFGGVAEHVELGWWYKSKQAWVNTYGMPFSREPDAWAPLAPFHSLPSPPAEAAK